MNPIAATLLFAGVLLASGCGTGSEYAARSGDELAAPAPGTAIVVGTCLDGDTGEPLAGVEVVGPGGVKTRSDDRGRFVLADLPVGAAGEVVATARDGRRAQNPLRPLKNARLEVVLRLR
jgi:hypothetical protein